MNNPFIATIIPFAGNFAPRGWALCDGQLLPISQNTALFSIIGTTYGGDGRTTFGLPDLRGRTAMQAGNGPGLSDRRLGAKGGSENNTMLIPQMPSHNHVLRANEDPDTDSPLGAVISSHTEDSFSTQAATENMGSTAVSNTGGGQSINNIQPFLATNYIIALLGIYPSRN